VSSCHDGTGRAQSAGCHGTERRRRWPFSHRHAVTPPPGGELVVALAGNPNVGKSTLFNAVTGGSVETANFPGTTITVAASVVTVGDTRVRVVDLPGTYAIGGSTLSDQALGRRALQESEPDVVVVIADASNLARNLYLVLQILDLELPTIVALNLMDEAAKVGLMTDVARLQRALRVPVIPTIASRKVGIPSLIETVLTQRSSARPPKYGRALETAVAEVAAALPEGATRADSLMLLEGDAEAAQRFPEAAEVARRRVATFEQSQGAGAVVTERHRLAAHIATSVQHHRGEPPEDRAWKIATHPVTGLLLLAGVLGGLVSFLFFVGNALATGFSSAWAATASPLIQGLVHATLGTGVFARTVLWGLDAGVSAALGVGIPYVLTVYFLIAILEDSGYLNAAAFFADRAMTRLGLHGRAVIPLFTGFGCSVPAIIGTRVLGNKRERTIASMLIVLIPCSARTAVIAGAVARFAGWGPALIVFATDLVLVAAAGRGLNMLLPGRPAGMIMEVFSFRRPVLRHVLRKTWHRFRSFVVVATPIVVLGSFVLGAVYETGLMWKLTRPLSLVVEDWLLLPPVAGLALIFAVLRKELALQLLVTLAIVQYGTQGGDLRHFMTAPQIVTYALVNTIYIPCVATFAVMKSELGMRRTLAITAGSVGMALLVGGIAARVLPHVL